MIEPEGIAGSNVDWANQTILNPLGFAIVVVCGIATLLLPRRYALAPMLIVACFVAPAQRLTLVGLDFSLLRIMVLFGWARLLINNELRGLTWKPLDQALVLLAAVSTVMHTLQQQTSAALIFKLGETFDTVGMYFFFRALIRSWNDLATFLRVLCVTAAPVAVAFLIENQTGRNMFAYFGGVPETTLVREGRLRCQGAFAHPIMAGCFWAALLPLVVVHFRSGALGRTLAALGIAAMLVIIVCCASSTPVTAVLFALLAAGFFRLRAQMRGVRWALVAVLAGLHLIMEKGVWHLISRIDIVAGNTGWHRYYLIDQAINRFGEWWLVGTPGTSHWGWGLQDVTNQYVLEGVRGGALSLAMFILVLVRAYQAVGRLWRLTPHDRQAQLQAWTLGVCLFVHTMNFIAVSYFGQIMMVWYLNLALIGSLAPGAALLRRRAARKNLPEAAVFPGELTPDGAHRGVSHG